MKAAYQIPDRQESRALAQFFSGEGQASSRFSNSLSTGSSADTHLISRPARLAFWGDNQREPHPGLCIGDTITFTLSGVADSGGLKRENCVVVPDGPVQPPEYVWIPTIPPDYPMSLPPWPPTRWSTVLDGSNRAC